MVFNLQAIMFMGVPQKEITIENIREFIVDEATKRINFASSHVNALRRTEQEQGGKNNPAFCRYYTTYHGKEVGSR